MKRIALTQGLLALVDDLDFGRLNRYRWYATRRESGLFHAARTVKLNGRKITVYMHRAVLRCSSTPEVDHRNGDGLDNRRLNIRQATKRQNAQNRRQKHRQRPKTSQFHGVSFSSTPRPSRWRAVICGGPLNAKGYARQLYLGQFRSEIEAAKAFDRAAIRLFGEFALTNFPLESYA